MQDVPSASPDVPEQRLHGQYWSDPGDGTAALIASACVQCQAAYLPSIARCTHCGGREFSPRPLPQEGQLYTYTIIHKNGSVWPPIYTIGYVDYPEDGVRVCGQILETDPQALRIGMAMRAEPAVLYTDDGGHPVHCFRFRAAGEAQ